MKELRQRFWLRLTTWLTLSACFSVLVGAGLAAVNMSRLLTLWGDDIQVTAYLSPDATEKEIGQIEKALRAHPLSGRVDFVSREKALSEFRAQLSSYAPDLAGDDDLLSLIPASFQVSLSSSLAAAEQPVAVTRLSETAQHLKGVDEVRYGQEWIKKYAAVVSTSERMFFFIGAVLLIACFFVIGNTVRASVDARRSEIEVLELVGATKAMIRKPYLFEGAILGATSALTALIASAAIFREVKILVATQMESTILAANLTFLPMASIAMVVVAGGMIGLISSFLCIRRVNTGFAAAGSLD